MTSAKLAPSGAYRVAAGFLGRGRGIGTAASFGSGAAVGVAVKGGVSLARAGGAKLNVTAGSLRAPGGVNWPGAGPNASGAGCASGVAAVGLGAGVATARIAPVEIGRAHV